MTDQNKIIIPLPPRFIVGKLQLGPLELAWDQVKILLICTLLTTIVVGSGEGTSGLLLNFIELSVIWGLFYKYARTHDVLVESKIMLGHRIRKLKGLNKYSSVSSPDKHISELYRFSIKSVSKTGIIDFGKNRFGVILGCDTRWLDDEELTLNIARVNGFLNSIQPGTLLKVRASSHIPYLNPVEKMVMTQVNQSRSTNEKALLYSLHDLSSRTPKTTDWDVKIFISMRSDPKEIETRMMTLIPGVKNRLQAAHTVSAVITHPDKIYNILANDNTGYHVHANRTPAFYGEKAIWKNILRQIMQGSIIENKDHLLVNNTEYISCLIVGIPIGGVSGFPPTLSPGDPDPDLPIVCK